MTRPAPDLKRETEFAADAARQAGKLVMEHWRRGVTVETKADLSPVTVADREAEQFLRSRIADAFPADGVLGEEFGETKGTSGRRWILDPIDGTKSFVHGVPLYGVMIGLEADARCVVGAVHIPGLDETVWAGRGTGAWWLPAGRPSEPPRPARVSDTARIEDAVASTSGWEYWKKAGRLPVFHRLIETVKVGRGWGDCYGHLLVATGRLDLMVDPLMNPWDCAALMPILLEAGGTFTDSKGDFTIYGKDGIATNGKLLDAALRLFAGT